jgi:hypothetical protein
MRNAPEVDNGALKCSKWEQEAYQEADILAEDVVDCSATYDGELTLAPLYQGNAVCSCIPGCTECKWQDYKCCASYKSYPSNIFVVIVLNVSGSFS